MKDLREKNPTPDEQIKKLQEALEAESKLKDESYVEMEAIFTQNQEWEEKHVALLT